MEESTHGKFEPGTKIAKCFETLSDHDWHCGKHALPGTQTAGLIREIKNRGYEVERKKMFCPVSGGKHTQAADKSG